MITDVAHLGFIHDNLCGCSLKGMGVIPNHGVTWQISGVHTQFEGQ